MTSRDLAVHLCICVFIFLLCFRIWNKIDAAPYRPNNLTELLRNSTMNYVVYRLLGRGRSENMKMVGPSVLLPDRAANSNSSPPHLAYQRCWVPLLVIPHSSTPFSYTTRAYRNSVVHISNLKLGIFSADKKHVMQFLFHKKLENFCTAEGLSPSQGGLLSVELVKYLIIKTYFSFIPIAS
jgi:hypothetical protein